MLWYEHEQSNLSLILNSTLIVFKRTPWKDQNIQSSDLLFSLKIFFFFRLLGLCMCIVACIFVVSNDNWAEYLYCVFCCWEWKCVLWLVFLLSVMTKAILNVTVACCACPTDWGKPSTHRLDKFFGDSLNGLWPPHPRFGKIHCEFFQTLRTQILVWLVNFDLVEH